MIWSINRNIMSQWQPSYSWILQDKEVNNYRKQMLLIKFLLDFPKNFLNLSIN